MRERKAKDPGFAGSACQCCSHDEYGTLPVFCRSPKLFVVLFSVDHFFHSTLKTPLSANPSHCSLFFYLRMDYMIPQTFTVTSSIAVFTF